MLTLKEGLGRVPVPTGDPDHPIKLIDFPSREEFDALLGTGVKAENKGRQYEMLKARAGGATLPELAIRYGLTRERVRQIEERFLRLMRRSQASAKASL